MGFFTKFFSFFRRNPRNDSYFNEIKVAINEKIEKIDNEVMNCPILPKYHGDYESNLLLREFYKGVNSGLFSALQIIEKLEGK